MDQDIRTAKKIIRDFKMSLEFTPMSDGVRVFAIAVANDSEENTDIVVPCDDGEPLNNEVYDFVKDAFHVTGVSFIDLGEVPMSFCVRMKDVYGWEEDIPLPKTVINRLLSDTQKSLFKLWQSDYPADKYKILFLQMKED